VEQRGSSDLLAGRRVVELCDESGWYCGKLLADAGAEVVKIEPPGGDPGRRVAPLWAEAPADCAPSLRFLYRNTNKRSVVLDLSTERDRERLASLAAGADLLIETMPRGALAEIGLGFERLRAANPRLVMTSITGFGQTGPHAGFASSDLIANAMGGVMYVTGEGDDPPVTLRGDHAHVMASTCAAASSMIAMLRADRTGRGQQVDISVQEVVASVAHITGVGKWLDDGIVPRRMGSGLFASIPSGAYRCRDGLIYLMVNRPSHWQTLARWIHEVTGEEAVLDPIFEGPSSARFATRELVDHFIARLTERFTVAEVYHEGQRRHLAVAPVNRMLDVVDDSHLAAREFFVEVDHAGARLRYPASVYRSAGGNAARPRPVPAAGADSIAALDRTSQAPVPRAADATAPLQGVRVVELTAGMAGPWIGRFMAYHGAEVIKVESRDRPDVTRQYVSPSDPDAGIQSQLSPWLTDWNAGKRCVALDLTKPGAVQLAKRLVAVSDVVIENYANGVVDKLGLGRDVLLEANPALVMISSTGYGDSGPCKSYISWGPNIEALSGLSAIDGFPGRECTMTQYAYPDSLSALHGLFAVLAALDHRCRTGRGQAIDLSQLEASIAVVGELAMEAMASGGEPEKLGNRSQQYAPHGCYRCAGDDRWCAIAVRADEEWLALCRVIDRDDLSTDGELRTAAGRLQQLDRIDTAIEQWTRGRDPYEVMQSLQAVGVCAGVVQTTVDQYENDRHLRERGYFEKIEHEVKGTVVANGIPTGLTETPGRTPHAGRAIGADNQSIFRGLLGLSKEEYESMIADGAIE